MRKVISIFTQLFFYPLQCSGISGVVLLGLMLTGHSAGYAGEKKNIENSDTEQSYTLTHEEYTYTYKKVPVFHGDAKEADDLRRRREAFSGGLLTVKDQEGQSRGSYQGIAAPGCDNFPAISVIEGLPTRYDPAAAKYILGESYIVLCGSNIIRLFHTGYGFAAALNFRGGPVNLAKNKAGDYIAIVSPPFEENLSPDVYALPEIPRFYTLRISSVENIYFSSELTDDALRFYQSEIRKYYKEFLDNDTASYLVRIMATAAFTGDEESYCNSLGIINDRDLYRAKAHATDLIGAFKKEFRMISCHAENTETTGVQEKTLSEFESMLEGFQTCLPEVVKACGHQYLMTRDLKPDVVRDGAAWFSIDEKFYGLPVDEVYMSHAATDFVFCGIDINAPIDAVRKVLSPVFYEGFYSPKDLDFGDRPVLMKIPDDPDKTALLCTLPQP